MTSLKSNFEPKNPKRKVTWKTEDKQTIFYCLFLSQRFAEFNCIELKDMQQHIKHKMYSRITIVENVDTTLL